MGGRHRLELWLVGLVFAGFFFGLFSAGQAEEGKSARLSPRHRRWLEEEVIYIISEKEKDVFLSLKSEEERERFIQAFWRRRDPTPETPVNEFREEHYRRLAYANEHFFEGKPGWKTDRGRVYIMFGPPDFVETNPSGGRGFLFGPAAPTAEFPSEVWTYLYLPGVKARFGRVEFIFVNYYNSGSYELTFDPALANALRNISLPARYVGYGDFPQADNRILSPLELAEQSRRLLAASPLEKLYFLTQVSKSRGEVLEEMERSRRLRKLKGIVETRESLANLPFFYGESYFRGRSGLTYLPISLEIPAQAVGFRRRGGTYYGQINFYLEVKDERGLVVYQGGDSLKLTLKEKNYQQRLTSYYQYNHALNLKPGRYFLRVVIWDEVSGRVGYLERRLAVPALKNKELDLSEIVLARQIEVKAKRKSLVIPSQEIPQLKMLSQAGLKVPAKLSLARRERGPFIFDNLRITPNPQRIFSRQGELFFFYQIYLPTKENQNLQLRLTIDHRILKEDQVVAQIDSPRRVVISSREGASSFGLNQFTRFSLQSLAPGRYTLQVKVRDESSGQGRERKVDFIVR